MELCLVEILLSLFYALGLFKQTAVKVIEEQIVVPQKIIWLAVGLEYMMQHTLHFIKIEMRIIVYPHFIAAIGKHSVYL